VWVDRKGHEEPIKAPLRAYGAPRLAPDGTRIVVDIKDRQKRSLDLGSRKADSDAFDIG